MYIKFLQDFRQYKKGDEYIFEKFSVITGVNGSGKTNLLRAINNLSEGLLIDEAVRDELKVHIYDYSSIINFPSHLKTGITINSNNYYLGTVYSEYQDFLKGRISINSISERLKRFAESLNKSLKEITREDFIKDTIKRTNERIELFHHNFFRDTGAFITWQEMNKFNAFRNSEYGEDNLVFTDEEFVNEVGRAPWEVVNESLEQFGFKYRFIQPRQYYRRGHIEFKLFDLEIEEEVPIEYLSGGEQTILAFITSLYDSMIVNQIPDIVLFDEVDAFLHPSFSRKMIEIIEVVLINKLNCQVLLVTHSPSTVAMSPYESIYLCERKSRKIQKVSKDMALKELTKGVNFLSISHRNIKQVFVEDEEDAFFHSSMYRFLQQKLISDINLNFIAVSTARNEKTGGCAKVKSIVKQLASGGNKKIFGIIDFDLKNIPAPPLFSMKKRYSIENYVFDPVIVVGYLIREKLLDKSKFELPEDFRYTDLENLPKSKIQALVDEYFSLIEFDFSSETDTVEYVNGVQLQMPKDYLLYPGHELEKVIEKINPKIFARKKGYKSLKHAIISDVIDDLRGFIPVEIADTYMNIQQK